MAAAQLWLLGVFPVELGSDGVQQLQIILLGQLFQRFDKRPAQGTPGLAVLEGVSSVRIVG